MSMGQLFDICKVCANRCVVYLCGRQLRFWTICDPYNIQYYDWLLIYLTLGYRCLACLLFPIKTPIPASIVTWSSSFFRCHLIWAGWRTERIDSEKRRSGLAKKAKIIVKRIEEIFMKNHSRITLQNTQEISFSNHRNTLIRFNKGIIYSWWVSIN